MAVVMRLVGLRTAPFISVHDGLFLKTFDPHWREDGPDANGLMIKELTTTADYRHARVFPSAAEALLLHKRRCPNRPKLPNGSDNCPLYAFDIELVNVKVLEREVEHVGARRAAWG